MPSSMTSGRQRRTQQRDLPRAASWSLVARDGRLGGPEDVPYREREALRGALPAQIKIDTFNFTRYGLRHGSLLSVSSDAIVQDRPGDRAQLAGAGDPSSQALIYLARVSLDKTRMQVDDNIVDLTPGIAVTVEISIGSRTVMSYLLSPLLKYAHDSLREK